MKVEVAEPMEIHFCDLCNESVPEADLRAGRAQRRKDRVICATCEAAMSHAGEEAPQPGAAGAPSAAGAPARRRRRRRRRGGGGLAFLAILFTGLGGAWIYREFDRARGELVAETERLEGELARARTTSAQLAGALDRRTAALEQGIQDGLESNRRELAVQIAELRRGLEGFGGRIDELQTLTAGVANDLAELSDRSGERMDELTAQLNRGRQEVTFFSDRLAALEQVVQGGALQVAAPRPAAEAPAPAWAAALAELDSDNAGDRWNAVQTLGESGDAAVVPHLLPVLDDEDVFVRMAAARVLGDLGAPEAIEPLIDTLEDEDPAVREMAMVSLRAITGRNFKFDAVASPAERAKKVKAWRQWWKKAQEEFLPGSGEAP